MDAVAQVVRSMRFVLLEGLPVDASMLDAWRSAVMKAAAGGRPELMGLLPRLNAAELARPGRREAALAETIRVIDPRPAWAPILDRERGRLAAVREQVESIVARMESCVAATESDVADWAMDLDIAAALAGEETTEGQWLIWAAQCLRVSIPSFRRDFEATRAAWVRRLHSVPVVRQ